MESKKIPNNIGAVLKGWEHGPKSVIDFRAMTEACPHDCPHCFTDKLKKTLTLREIKYTLDQIADLGFKSIDYLGEGEPTLDRDFFPIIEYTSSKNLQSIIFTDAATKMRDRNFVKRVYDTGASVVPKCDSIFNPEYQNWIVGDKKGKYFMERMEALNLLMAEGFNAPSPDGTTRFGHDMVLSKRNMDEVEDTLHFCRKNNLWIVFTFFLPTGRSGKKDFDKDLVPSREDKIKIMDTVSKIDSEYGFEHPNYNNFITSPCVEEICIYGDGRVSPCVGNETIVGNIKSERLESLIEKVREKFPCHRIENYDGNCPYRELY